jgi:hypothetical protein
MITIVELRFFAQDILPPPLKHSKSYLPHLRYPGALVNDYASDMSAFAMLGSAMRGGREAHVECDVFYRHGSEDKLAASHEPCCFVLLSRCFLSHFANKIVTTFAICGTVCLNSQSA